MSNKKNIIVIMGGNSPEHEVSVLTGLQVLENIDKRLFNHFAVRLTKEGRFEYYKNYTRRQDYLRIKPEGIQFGKDEKGTFFQTAGLLKNKVYIDAAYLAFHGGNGESGQLQGFFETLNLSYTSPGVETSSIAMNKVLTKEVLEQNGIKTVPYARVFSESVLKNVNGEVKNVLAILSLPVIIKPAHLGSSIGINIAKTNVELKKYLLEASHVDTEILIEKLITNFQEYNVSVRRIDGVIQISEVERPIMKGEILSFADKYQRGGKKTGGMASLSRELPAKITDKLRKRLQSLAEETFKIIRAKSMVRIDFMVSGNDVFVTEVNPIPGSMSFYLWEAMGISFKDQITDLINQAIKDNEEKDHRRLDYKSDIIEKFVNNKDH